jgi:hypothetical protein
MPDNCAVAAETSLINQFVPEGLSLAEANYISMSNGWWQPGSGTSPSEIGNLMDVCGIPNHTVMNADCMDLVQELQNGHGIIVGVNSAELWDQGITGELKNWLIENLGLDNAAFTRADHAVVVTGIDYADPENPLVILNDSGTPDGAGAAYPLEKFVDAWENSGFYYTATDIPLPADRAHGLGSLDIGSFLGKDSSLFVNSITQSPDTAGINGKSLDQMSHNIDWDSVLRSI